MKTTTAVLGAALLLAAMPLAALPAEAAPSYAEQNDRIVLANEHVTLDFQGKKPMLHVRPSTNDSRDYTVILQRIVEVPQGASLTGNGEVASFGLAPAEDWVITHTSDASGVTVTMHREGRLEAKGPGKQPQGLPLPEPIANLTNTNRTLPGNASVTLVFHLADTERMLRVGNATATVTAYEVKFDVSVDKWDWVDKADVLALEFVLAGPAAQSTMAPGAQGQELGVSDQGTRIGFVRWLPAATATTGENTTIVPVEHRSAGNDAQGAKHWLVYGASGFDRLQHDPSVGVEPAEALSLTGGKSTPLGPMLLLALPAAALLALRRRI